MEIPYSLISARYLGLGGNKVNASIRILAFHTMTLTNVIYTRETATITMEDNSVNHRRHCR